MAIPIRMLTELICAARAPSPPAFLVSSGATLAEGAISTTQTASRMSGGNGTNSAAQAAMASTVPYRRAKNFAMVFRFSRSRFHSNKIPMLSMARNALAFPATSASFSTGAGSRRCSAASRSISRYVSVMGDPNSFFNSSFRENPPVPFRLSATL